MSAVSDVVKRVREDVVIRRFESLIDPHLDEIELMYLFGSRCRDDWRPDSDYDVLVIVRKRSRELKSRLYDAVMDVLLETGRLVSLKIVERAEFERLRSIPTPFLANVLREGVQIGPVH
ncbi:MAG: nucleotidyltransferase domain-containing protein [Acidobacteria bacterium]|nr:nucleotidyltransferase domain-containing protein [Acidobacteriota bacterium]